MIIPVKGVDCRVVGEVNRGAMRVFGCTIIMNEDDFVRRVHQGWTEGGIRARPPVNGWIE